MVSPSAGDLGPVVFVVTNSNSLDFLVCVCFLFFCFFFCFVLFFFFNTAAVLNFHQKKVSNKAS